METSHAALHLLPRLGRKKLLIGGKARGRNELISNYIYRTTGQERSRKQVSSHIQVLKNMYRNDAECELRGAPPPLRRAVPLS